MSGFRNKTVGVSGASIPADNFSGGLFDYNDAATAITPISVTGGNAPLVLTNDAAGPFTNTAYAPVGVTSVWDEVADEFDWTELGLGDMVDIRLDITVTTLSVNTEVKVDLHLGVGGGEYTIPWVNPVNIKATGTYKNVTYNGVYLGDSNTLDNTANFRISSDKNCTVVVNGWYVKIIRRG
jgi:hypothetical protein